MQVIGQSYLTGSGECKMLLLVKAPTSSFPGFRNLSSLIVAPVHAMCLSSQAAKVHNLLTELLQCPDFSYTFHFLWKSFFCMISQSIQLAFWKCCISFYKKKECCKKLMKNIQYMVYRRLQSMKKICFLSCSLICLVIITFESVFSTDLQNVNITLRILFRPVTTQLPRIFTSIGEDYDERVLPSITTEVLKSVVVSIIQKD